jgi:GH25 family lysozyme M1 (1,4-beta-N-acetylmuramidase)
MNGIDISHFQGVVDYEKLVSNQPPIDFIYFKATQGVGYTDPMLKTNVNSADAIGLKWGLYHYATLNTVNIVEDAKAEAEYFLSVVNLLPKYKLPLVLDLEDEKGATHYNLSKADVLGWVNTFFDTLEKANHLDYALYSYTPFLNANLPIKHNLGGIRLWIAQYTTKPQPIIPSAWKEWWLWQYSDKGSVNGIKGRVDTNVSKNNLH